MASWERPIWTRAAKGALRVAAPRLNPSAAAWAIIRVMTLVAHMPLAAPVAEVLPLPIPSRGRRQRRGQESLEKSQAAFICESAPRLLALVLPLRIAPVLFLALGQAGGAQHSEHRLGVFRLPGLAHSSISLRPLLCGRKPALHGAACASGPPCDQGRRRARPAALPPAKPLSRARLHGATRPRSPA